MYFSLIQTNLIKGELKLIHIQTNDNCVFEFVPLSLVYWFTLTAMNSQKGAESICILYEDN